MKKLPKYPKVSLGWRDTAVITLMDNNQKLFIQPSKTYNSFMIYNVIDEIPTLIDKIKIIKNNE